MLISKFSTHGTEVELAAFEEKLMVTLPESYRKFLLKYNGGETPKTEFKIGKESSDLRAFLGLGDVAYCITMEVELDNFVKKQMIPIAIDSFGNYITIGIGDENFGKIYFCDHEKSYKETLLSEDLKEFVTHCKSKKIGKVLTLEERERMVLEAGKVKITDGLRRLWQDEIDKYSNIKQERVVID